MDQEQENNLPFPILFFQKSKAIRPIELQAIRHRQFVGCLW